MVGLGLSSEALVSSVVDRATPTVARPKEGDVLVFAFGPREGEVIKPDDIAPAVPQVFAYPMDPSTGEVGSDSRLNQVMLVRVDPGGLSEDTLARSADGVVAYSGVCTHTGCDVTDWDEDEVRFQCPCHESEFDPSDGARVIGGPAPRRLAALPLKIVDGVLTAASGFTGRVGFTPP